MTENTSHGDKFEWIFDQKHAYSGLQRIYWTTDALKIVNETQGFSLVCKAGILDLSLVDSPVVAPQLSDLSLAYY